MRELMLDVGVTLDAEAYREIGGEMELEYRSERSWSCASAFVGNISSAVAGSSRTTESMIGSW